MINKTYLIGEYINKKKSRETIGKETNTSEYIISKALKKYNIPLRNRSEARKGIEPVNKGIKNPNCWGNLKQDIIKRDKCCKICNTKNKLEVHHIKSKEKYPELSLNKDNLITLCQKCHKRLYNFIYPKKFIEKIFNKTFKQNYNSIGLDLATNTGICIINSKDKNIIQLKLFSYKFKNTKNCDIFITDVEIITKQILKLIELSSDTQVIIEDCFYRKNFNTFKFLSRLSGIFFVKMSCFNHISYLHASSARKNLELKGNCKKKEVKEFLAKKLYVYIEDDNQADAIILALNGILE